MRCPEAVRVTITVTITVTVRVTVRVTVTVTVTVGVRELPCAGGPPSVQENSSSLSAPSYSLLVLCESC